MENSSLHSDHVSVYPGIYERAWSEKELQHALQKKDLTLKAPVVHMQHFQDHYRIEMAIPGYNKESFFIHTKGHVLTITGINKKHPELAMENSVSKTHHKCFTHNIILPVDADTDFVSAEYNNGILLICLSTSSQPVE